MRDFADIIPSLREKTTSAKKQKPRSHMAAGLGICCGGDYFACSCILRISMRFSRSAMNWGSTFGRSWYGMFST